MAPMPKIRRPRSLLHVLRLTVFVDDRRARRTAGLDTGASGVGAGAQRRRRGHVRQHRAGTLTGWGLTPEGRARARGAAWPPSSTPRAAAPMVEAAYRRFLALNRRAAAGVHRLAGARRRRAAVLNDHPDPDYDRGGARRPGRRCTRQSVPMLAELAEALRPLRCATGRRLDRAVRPRAAAASATGSTKPTDRLVPHRVVRAARGPAAPPLAHHDAMDRAARTRSQAPPGDGEGQQMSASSDG